MNIFRSTALFLGTLGVVGVTALSIDTTKASADATTTVQVNTFTPAMGKVYGENSVNDSKIGGTWVVKQGIKGIIRNRAAAVKVVSQVMGKKEAALFNSYYYNITGGLQPLLAWSEVPAQAAYDATLRSLLNAGLTKANAANVALAVKIGINLFI